MPCTVSAFGRTDGLDREIERVSALLRDLCHLRANSVPRAHVIENAPTLHDWSAALRPVTCLTGRVLGHPRLTDDKTIVTSPICVMAVDIGFVRTENRFYRLGRSARGSYDA